MITGSMEPQNCWAIIFVSSSFFMGVFMCKGRHQYDKSDLRNTCTVACFLVIHYKEIKQSKTSQGYIEGQNNE